MELRNQNKWNQTYPNTLIMKREKQKMKLSMHELINAAHKELSKFIHEKESDFENTCAN